jgi:hypothetical protein
MRRERRDPRPVGDEDPPRVVGMHRRDLCITQRRRRAEAGGGRRRGTERDDHSQEAGAHDHAHSDE